jgi:hypothetical protein
MGLLSSLFGGRRSRRPEPQAPIDAAQTAGRFMFGDDFVGGRGMADPEFQQRVIEAERRFGPEYVQNELARQQRALFGTEGQEGLLGLYEQAAPITERMRATTASAQRAADVGDIERYGPRAVEAIRQADPARARLIEQQQGLTDELYGRAQGITPQQRRMAQQSAREAFGARGREMDNVGIFGEALGREEFLRQNRAEAMNAGQGLYGMLSGSGADPMQAVLGRQAQSMPYNLQTAQGAMGAARLGTPQTFSPDAGVNLALAQRGQDMELQSNVYGAQQTRAGETAGGFFGMLGSIIPGLK